MPTLADLRLVAITDRARMGDDFGAAVARVVRPGVAVQVREKDLEGAALLALVRAAMSTGAPVLVNDRLDVALAAGAAGVHLPERGLGVATARALAPPGFVIGVSVHSLDDVARAADAGADLIQLGPIWATPGKGAPLGLAALTAARTRCGAATLVAVGGLDSAARVDAAIGAGAHAAAAIRAAWTGAVFA